MNRKQNLITTLIATLMAAIGVSAFAPFSSAGEFRNVALRSTVDQVQPMTGIVLWSDNDAVDTAPIQLEFAYVSYAQVASKQGAYDWTAVETLLNNAAGRRHQMVLRFFDTYVGRQTGIPEFVTRLPGYRTTHGRSEKKPTDFPDWSHPELQRFVLDFFSSFAQKYDRDPRLAFLQVGFGLWSEYHIYDGPLILGRTFPSHQFQSEFARHMAATMRQTPWMISVDAAGDWAPFAGQNELLDLPFGVFDDSINHKLHAEENEPNWNTLGRDRWQFAPAGGEFSFFKKADQKQALAPRGPHGKSFERQAADFHLTFIVGDDQPRFQSSARIRSAGLACGYRFRIARFEATDDTSRGEIENVGIAPIYYDAFPSVNGERAVTSLKGLLPGQRMSFEVHSGGIAPRLTIACDRLVEGQVIGFDAELN